MRAQKILGFSLLLTLVPLALSVWVISPVRAGTLYVPSPDYPTIQSAVNAAGAGDIIQVAAGTYPENVVVSTRDLTIIGENAATTIVDGGGKNTVFSIQENNVEIRQFTVRNGGRRFNGINVYYPYGAAVIRSNIIRDNVAGVALSESNGNIVEGNTFLNNSMYGVTSEDFSASNTIKDNTISDSPYGIELSDTSSSQVVNNTVSGASYGTYLAYSNNNNVSANKLTSNSWNIYLSYSNSNIVKKNSVLGGSVGIQIMRSEGNSVFNNTVSVISYGIYLGYCGANTVSGNTASSSDWGIELYSTTGSTVSENLVKDNSWGFYLAESCKNNYVYFNNIINNVKQVFQDPTSSPNTWNTPTAPYKGNYWSDYKGSDTDGDGTGDTYLPWAGVDWHPLMVPFGVHDVAIISVSVPVTVVYKGEEVNITVVAENQGGIAETFTVTAYANTSAIEAKTVTSLAPGNNQTLFFIWDTENWVKGNYTIKAQASVVLGETETGDNFFIDGVVRVKLQGDVNGDGSVDAIDFALFGMAWGSFIGEPNYDPRCDFNHDGAVNSWDLAVLAKYYGQ